MANPMASDLNELRSLKIHFNDRSEEERGFYALLTSGMPVKATERGHYIINEKQCQLLSKKGIKYIKE